jgi:phosphate-selective porin OprO and OprP
MLFRRVRQSEPVLLLIVCCLFSRPINCQRTWEHVRVPAATTPSASGTWRPASFTREGFTVSKRDESSQVKVHGYVGADGRFFVANLKDQQHDVFLFRRVRPLVEGTLAHRIDFRFMPDFAESNAVIQEAYAAWKPAPVFSFTLGKFKTPLGLELLRPDQDLTFAERSMVTDLLPRRDLGAQLEGTFLRDAITYEAGYFSGAEDGTNAKFEWRGTSEGVGRVFLRPFELAGSSALRPLGLGAAVSAGRSHHMPPTFLTVGQQTIFKYSPGIMAIGQHKRITPQADYFFGPFGLLAEYAISDLTVRNGSQHRWLANHAWQFAGSIVLTGEENSYRGGIQPAHAFTPTQGFRHWGAWEIAFRHSALTFDTNAFPQYASPTASAKAASEWAAGVNWCVNRYVKFVADYEHTSFQMASDTVPNLTSENVVMTRVQLAF